METVECSARDARLEFCMVGSPCQRNLMVIIYNRERHDKVLDAFPVKLAMGLLAKLR